MATAAEVPQPKTFAPSREDVLNTLSFFFGSPVSPEKLRDYSEHHAATYHFPDAYAGQNIKIRDTLNNLLLKQPQNWQTSIGLPFFRIESTVVEWDEIKYDVRLLQRVPYEGVSRMQTSLRRRHRDRVVRHGVGLMIESDFYATEAGRQHFADQLTSIRYCVQETCNYDVLFAYLTCTNYDFRYDLQKSLRPRRNIKSAMMHEINFYAIVQKEGLGMDKCIEDSKYRMKRYGVTPDLLCVPPQLLLYMALAPEEKLLYDKGGPNAAATFEAGVEGFKARQYRGMGVVTSDPFEITDDSEAVQMLQRSTQVGEFYVMGPPVVPLNMEDPKGARNFLDIVVFDEESDRHVVIPWEDAVAASFCEMVQQDGEKVNPGTKLTKSNGIAAALDSYKNQTNGDKNASTGEDLQGTRAEENLTAAEWRELANCWRIIAKMGTRGNDMKFPATDAAVGALTGGTGEMSGPGKDPFSIGLDFRGRSIQKFMEEPKFRVYCVVARPFIEHVMQSAVMTVSGRDTGAMLFGPSDMQISANTQVKTIEGHYTGHFKAVIHKPQNVFVMRDIACSAYVAGMNTQFFGFEKNQTIAKRYTSNRAKNQIMRRLSFADEVGSKYQSCMSFPASAAEYEEGSMDTVISVTSRVLPWEVNPSQHHENFPGGEDMYKQYQQILQLGQIHYGEDTRAAENMDFISQGATNNALCFMGPHRKFSHISRSHFELIPGQGHFGPDALPGDARWRRGETVSQKTARDQMISLEAVASSQLAFQPRG